MNNFVGLVLSYIFVFFLIIISKKVEKFGTEASRKFIHIFLGFWWVIAMIFFDNVIWASIAPATFVIINYLSYKYNLIKVMEREKNEGLGTVYFAISLLILSIFSFGVFKRPILGLIPTLVLALGDGLAAVVGKAVKSPTYKIGNSSKSLMGSTAMFITTLILVSIYLFSLGISLWLFKAVIISIIATLCEAISIRGTDNLTVPMSMFIMIVLVTC